MKNIRLIAFILVSGLVFIGCSEQVETNEKKVDENAALTSSSTNLKIGEDNAGVLTITYAATTTLETELKNYWGLISLQNLRIEAAGGEYWLRGDGELAEGGAIDWAFLLKNEQNNLYLLDDAGAQSCTTRECCNSCALNITDKLAGNCDCSATDDNAECQDKSGTKSCNHIVTSSLSNDAEYTALFNHLAS